MIRVRKTRQPTTYELHSIAGTTTFVHAFKTRAILAIQIVATAAVLGWVPGNGIKLAAMLVIWAIGFGRISLSEFAVMAVVNLIFVGMDLGALERGIFRFRDPDFFGLPIYEFFMWGFYTLHTIRLVDGQPARPPRVILALAFAVAFSLPFSLIPDPMLLLAVTSAILLLALVAFGELTDLVYTSYVIALGAVIEYVGVGTGQWSYPHSPFGGVPLWSFAMWGGVGLFTRRLLLPLVSCWSRPNPNGKTSRQ